MKYYCTCPYCRVSKGRLPHALNSEPLVTNSSLTQDGINRSVTSSSIVGSLRDMKL